MSLFEKMQSSMRDQDASAYLDLLHDDYQFVRHQSGETLDKSAMAQLIEGMSASGEWSIDNERCLYENDDIIVSHSHMSFPDGTKEAVMSVNMVRDGKIVRTETGATPLKSL